MESSEECDAVTSASCCHDSVRASMDCDCRRSVTPLPTSLSVFPIHASPARLSNLFPFHPHRFAFDFQRFFLSCLRRPHLFCSCGRAYKYLISTSLRASTGVTRRNVAKHRIYVRVCSVNTSFLLSRGHSFDPFPSQLSGTSNASSVDDVTPRHLRLPHGPLNSPEL